MDLHGIPVVLLAVLHCPYSCLINLLYMSLYGIVAWWKLLPLESFYREQLIPIFINIRLTHTRDMRTPHRDYTSHQKREMSDQEVVDHCILLDLSKQW